MTSQRTGVFAVGLGLVLVSLVGAAGAIVEPTKRLEGWQKAKFGMTSQQVQAAYPNAVIDDGQIFYKNCATKLGHLKDWPEAIGALESPNSCTGLEIEDWDGGRDKFNVELTFSKSDDKLVEVKLTKYNADFAGYAYYKNVLESNYGKGQEHVEDNTERGCQYLESKLNSGGFRWADVQVNKVHTLMTFSLDQGTIVLDSSVTRRCDFYDRMTSPKWDYNSLGKAATISITYKAAEGVDPSIKQRF